MPCVHVNACHVGKLRPREVLRFPSAFFAWFWLRAAGRRESSTSIMALRPRCSPRQLWTPCGTRPRDVSAQYQTKNASSTRGILLQVNNRVFLTLVTTSLRADVMGVSGDYRPPSSSSTYPSKQKGVRRSEIVTKEESESSQSPQRIICRPTIHLYARFHDSSWRHARS